MRHSLILPAAVLAVALPGAVAAKDTVTLGMQLEPPHLDPTAGAAAAIDEVVYANVFEGLTRIGPDGSVNPALAGPGPSARMGSSTLSPSARVSSFTTVRRLTPRTRFSH